MVYHTVVVLPSIKIQNNTLWPSTDRKSTGSMLYVPGNTKDISSLDQKIAKYNMGRGKAKQVHLGRRKLETNVHFYSLSACASLVVTCADISKCYNCMCGARRRAGSARALLPFLVTCMHDAMQAICMLCTVWRTRDTVICGTEWFQMHEWTFWKVCERTGNPETLPDLGLLIQGMELQPIERRTRRD